MVWCLSEVVVRLNLFVLGQDKKNRKGLNGMKKQIFKILVGVGMVAVGFSNVYAPPMGEGPYRSLAEQPRVDAPRQQGRTSGERLEPVDFYTSDELKQRVVNNPYNQSSIEYTGAHEYETNNGSDYITDVVDYDASLKDAVSSEAASAIREAIENRPKIRLQHDYLDNSSTRALTSRRVNWALDRIEKSITSNTYALAKNTGDRQKVKALLTQAEAIAKDIDGMLNTGKTWHGRSNRKAINDAVSRLLSKELEIKRALQHAQDYSDDKADAERDLIYNQIRAENPPKES